jgi:hypothetical protein
MTAVSILLGKIFVKKYGAVNSTLMVKMSRKFPPTPLYERGEPHPLPFSKGEPRRITVSPFSKGGQGGLLKS